MPWLCIWHAAAGRGNPWGLPWRAFASRGMPWQTLRCDHTTCRGTCHIAGHGSTMACAMRTPAVSHEISPTACHGDPDLVPRHVIETRVTQSVATLRRLSVVAIRGMVRGKFWQASLEATINRGNQRQSRHGKPSQATASRGKPL